MIGIETKGDLKRTENFLQKMFRGDIYKTLEPYARAGVAALASATPVESGVTAASWSYEIKRSLGTHTIVWTNSHVVGAGQPLVIMLQYGHGTGTGGYVRGRDFINPAIKPIFDKIADAVWKEVTSA